MIRKLRFGVIGAGEFAEECHIPGLQSHSQAEVVALCGRHLDRVRALADRHEIPDVYTDYNELCQREDIDGITVVTPHQVHAEQAIAALRHRKHVLCEKPLAANDEEARQMVQAAEHSAMVHQVAFTFRYLYGVRELKRRIRAGDIGEPYYVRIQYDNWTGMQSAEQGGIRRKRDMAGAGMLFDLGSHLLDMVRFLFGPFKAITGFLHKHPREYFDSRAAKLVEVTTDDVASAWFVHENGVRGQWFGSRITSPFAQNGYVEVIGPAGALKASLSRGAIDSLYASSPSSPQWQELALPEQAYDKKAHCLGIMIRSFVDACLHNRIEEGDASFHDGLAVQRALSAVRKASDSLSWVQIED